MRLRSGSAVSAALDWTDSISLEFSAANGVGYCKYPQR